jgi:hypothetical protein
MEGDRKMQLIKTQDLGQGWYASLFTTGEMQVRNGTTGEVTWLPKESVDTLINICQEVKAETLAKKETN